jgi:hypothetical protein
MAHVMFMHDHAHDYEETDASKPALSFHTNFNRCLTNKNYSRAGSVTTAFHLQPVRQHLGTPSSDDRKPWFITQAPTESQQHQLKT